MNGCDVRTVDGDKVGHVVNRDGDFLIVKHGLLKSKHALPQVFADVDAGEQIVRTKLSKELIYDSLKLHNDNLDRTDFAEHYGLAEGYTDPPARALGDEEPADPMREHVEVRKEIASDDGRSTSRGRRRA